MFVVSRHQLS